MPGPPRLQPRATADSGSSRAAAKATEPTAGDGEIAARERPVSPGAGGSGAGGASRGAWSPVPWARCRERLAARAGRGAALRPSLVLGSGERPRGVTGVEGRGKVFLGVPLSACPWVTLGSRRALALRLRTCAPRRAVSSKTTGYLGDGKEL